MIKSLIFILGLSLLSGCTSSQMANSTCDFFEGSAKSQQRHNDPDSLQPTRDNRKINNINGVLNVLVAPLGRVMGEEKGCAEPESEPYWHDHNTVFVE